MFQDGSVEVDASFLHLWVLPGVVQAGAGSGLVDIWVLKLFISFLIWASIEALVFSGGSTYGMLTKLLFLMQHRRFFL